MTIKIVRDDSTEPSDWEHCCFCFKPSKHWYQPKDVAVCEACAATRRPSEVPTKAVWCAEVIRRHPHLNTSRFHGDQS
jgi:hypothetical protein